jgi:putative alpha-1,2-mannosidase
MLEAQAVRLGQLGMSNQPSHHIPYMYDYVGAPAKTQKLVREILQRLYIGSEIGQGYPGDEDNGEMSSWYILSSLGLYPLQAGSPNWVIGSPLFQKVTVHRSTGDIVINAPNKKHLRPGSARQRPAAERRVDQLGFARARRHARLHDGCDTVDVGNAPG